MTKRFSSGTSSRLAGTIITTIVFSSVLLPSAGLAQSTGVQTTTSGSITTLDLPRVEDYWFSATRQPGGTIILDGFAPDETTRKILAAHPKTDAQYLQLGSGAPEQYRSAMDFGLSILDRLSEGRFSLRDNVITLTGTAASQSDYLAIDKLLRAGAPSGLVLAEAELLAPKAGAYQWTATKSSGGSITLEGMVPDLATQAAMMQFPGVDAQAMTYSSGAPADFLSSAQLGLELLGRLTEGKIAFVGQGWTLTGTAGSREDKKALEAEFAERNLAASGWSMAVAEGTATAQTPSPAAVDPDYAFSAIKSSSGEVIFSGQVPADPAIRFFQAITGGNSDAVSIAPNAPPDFILLAEAGVRALMQLDEGTLSFSAGRWALSGATSDPQTRNTVVAALNASNATGWTSDIKLVSQPAPVAQPAIAPAVPPPSSVQEAPAAELAACEAPLADFSARNEISFRSGAAIIAPESAPALDELAADLASCPHTDVQVEGHTDADGDDQLNLALSVARAEAVIGALLERGIAPERLYALGFGETSPISTNDTPEGKRLNRRIVVKVTPAL